MEHKREEAVSILKSCFGVNGLWASGKDGRYQYQCWTRDPCLAIFAALILLKDSLENVNELIYRHFNGIIKHQRDDGKIPIIFLDDEDEFVRLKRIQQEKNKKIPFMLRRYLEGEITNLTPKTRDSEVLFIISANDFLSSLSEGEKSKLSNFEEFETSLENAMKKAMQYIEEIATDVSPKKDGLIKGADWRDVRDDLDDIPVLTNACFLYKCYKIMGNEEKAEEIKRTINEKYWNANIGHYNDHPESNSFGLLGNAVAVLYGIADVERINSVFDYAMKISTEHGIKTTETFLPPLNDEEAKVMARDKAVIWPFTNGFMLEAMLMKGGDKWKEVAKKEFNKWVKLEGFNEWYDIVDGKGYGSKNQAWSAALYIRVAELLKE